MYKNQYSPKFPFFNVNDEKELYKSLIKNPESTFFIFHERDVKCTVPLVYMCYEHWCGNTHMKNPPQSAWRDFWWIKGNYLPNQPDGCKRYAIRLYPNADGQKIMTMLYKRHRARFIRYYVNKMRSLI